MKHSMNLSQPYITKHVTDHLRSCTKILAAKFLSFDIKIIHSLITML